MNLRDHKRRRAWGVEVIGLHGIGRTSAYCAGTLRARLFVVVGESGDDYNRPY